jgi:hypothetical protein
MTNDWERIRQAIDSDDSLKPDTRRQLWKWTEPARSWMDANGIAAGSSTEADWLRFVSEVEPTSGSRNPAHRMWALRSLASYASTVAPRRARQTGTAASRLDAVPGRSPLGRAITQVLSAARTESDRRQWPTMLGAFLMWCDERGLEPLDLWEGHVDLYRRERAEAGFKGASQYAVIARKLARVLAEGR